LGDRVRCLRASFHALAPLPVSPSRRSSGPARLQRDPQKEAAPREAARGPRGPVLRRRSGRVG